MITLRICVLVHQQKNQDGFSFIYQSTINIFYGAQQGMPFIIAHGKVEYVIRSRFNIKTATKNWI